MQYLLSDEKNRIIVNEKETYNEVLMTKAEYEDLLARIECEKELNRNFKRICKERACKKAGKPKNSLGYFVLSSIQTNERYTREISFEQWRKENPKAHSSEYRSPVQCDHKVWKSTIQTPCDASIPFNIVNSLILDELRQNVFYPLGIRHMQKEYKNGIYIDHISESNELRNIVYRWSFKADFKIGFWIIEFYHILPLTVPEEFRL